MRIRVCSMIRMFNLKIAVEIKRRRRVCRPTHTLRASLHRHARKSICRDKPFPSPKHVVSSETTPAANDPFASSCAAPAPTPPGQPHQRFFDEASAASVKCLKTLTETAVSFRLWITNFAFSAFGPLAYTANSPRRLPSIVLISVWVGASFYR